MTQRRNPESPFFYSQFLNNNYLIVLSVTDFLHFFLISSTKKKTKTKNDNKNKIYEIGIASLVFLKSFFIVYIGYNPISFLQNFMYFYVTVSIIFLIQLSAKFLLLLFIKYIKNRKKVQQGKALAMQVWSLESHP